MQLTLLPNPEDKESVRQHLESAVRVVAAALDDGVSLAKAKFEDMKHDNALWSHLVRFGACCYIGAQTPDGWERGRKLGNSGIEILHPPFGMRVLKAQRGGPPHPGPNKARQVLWSPKMRLPGADCWGGFPVRIDAYFILDWDIDDDRELSSLHLSKTNGLWKYQEDPKMLWRHKVTIAAGEGLKFVGEEQLEPLAEMILDLGELRTSGDTQ